MPGLPRAVLETEDGRRFPLEAAPGGWFEAVLPVPAGAGYRYRLEIDGKESIVGDPAARAERDGFSVLVDASETAWTHDAWRGRPWHEAVLCQVGTGAPGGFDAAVGRLQALAELGVTAIVVDPVVRADGRVLPFAPDPARGGPEALHRLVDAAHGLGLMVIVGGIDAAVPLPGTGDDVDDGFLTECVMHWILDHRVDGVLLAARAATAAIATAAREAAGPHRRVHLLSAAGGDAPLPAGFDARWQHVPVGGLDAVPGAAATPVGREGEGADLVPAATASIAPAQGLATADDAALARLLMSPAIPCLVDEDADTLELADAPLGRLLRLRAERLVPHLQGAQEAGRQVLGEGAVVASWTLGDGSLLVVAANAGAAAVAWPDAPAASHRVFSSTGDTADLPAGSSRVYIVPGLPRDLADLAGRAGIALKWTDQTGQAHTVSRDTVTRVLEALGHPCDSPQAIVASLAALRAAQAAPAMLTARVGERLALPLPEHFAVEGLRATLTLDSGEARELLPAVREADEPGAVPTLTFNGIDTAGYHRLDVASGDRVHTVSVAVAPAKAFDAGLVHAWGTSVQIYALRPESGRDGPDPGLGDFSALAAFARSAGAAGAQVVAISPTHAGFAADPSNFSPYSPSSRLFHNVLFIDPLAVVGAEAARAAARAAGIDLAGAAPAPGEPLVDWPTAGALKLRWLRAIFDAQRPRPVLPMADPLRLHATFEALHARFHGEGRFDWREWPDDFQDPDSAEVAAFAEENADDVHFHAWLQALAEQGLRGAQDAARAAGMQVGLVADLAIGMSGSGSHAWASRRDLLVGLEIGAPPDPMNPRGQSWGLTAFSPRALVERRFEPFLQTLRAAMRQAGGVRIDHVLGLNRLWLVPHGLPASDGAYVSYPFRDFMNLLILESHRQRAIVIGEDLGTVPDGFREVLSEAGVRGMAVLWLERGADGIGFRNPADWSADAVAMTTTHDLPTAAGWWQARDIDWRERIGTEANAAAARQQRSAERNALAGLAPETAPASDGVDLAISAVSQAASALVLVPIEDLLGLVEQPNLPGTIDEHPNWRRRLPAAADRLLATEPGKTRVERLAALRGR